MIGTVSAEAARSTGLPAGCPLSPGQPLALPGLIGDGVCLAGDALVYYGSSGTCSSARSTSIRPSTIRAASVTGRPIGWRATRSTRACSSKKRGPSSSAAGPTPGLDALAEAVPPGANGVLVLPHVSGKLDPRAPAGWERGDRGAVLRQARTGRHLAGDARVVRVRVDGGSARPAQPSSIGHRRRRWRPSATSAQDRHRDDRLGPAGRTVRRVRTRSGDARGARDRRPAVAPGCP